MKRLLHSPTMVSIAAGIVLAANNAVGASDKQALDPIQNNTGNEPMRLAQNAAVKETKSSNTPAANVDSKGVILKGYDPVAYFKQVKALKGNPTIESNYQGVTYFFASTENKAVFDKDPAKYVPQYGGFCAYGVANGVLTNAESPNAFTVYKGKLYLCGNRDALKSLKTDIDENIEKADTYWRQVTGS